MEPSSPIGVKEGETLLTRDSYLNECNGLRNYLGFPACNYISELITNTHNSADIKKTEVLSRHIYRARRKLSR
jgi:hypothetical protein